MTSQLTALVLGLLGTTEQTRSPRSNKTGLLTLDSVPGDGRSLTNMLVVTTTVRVICRTVRLIYRTQGSHGGCIGALDLPTGFMATPRVLGQLLRLTANLCLAREASVGTLASQLLETGMLLGRTYS